MAVPCASQLPDRPCDVRAKLFKRRLITHAQPVNEFKAGSHNELCFDLKLPLY
jgi:hypothetical protein